jgi:hypothetical protein
MDRKSLQNGPERYPFKASDRTQAQKGLYTDSDHKEPQQPNHSHAGDHRPRPMAIEGAGRSSGETRVRISRPKSPIRKSITGGVDESYPCTAGAIADPTAAACWLHRCSRCPPRCPWLSSEPQYSSWNPSPPWYSTEPYICPNGSGTIASRTSAADG